MEIRIPLGKVAPLGFFGVQDRHLRMLRELFPGVRFSGRGEVLLLTGEDRAQLERARAVVEALLERARAKGKIDENDILGLVEKMGPSGGPLEILTPKRRVVPRTPNQERYLRAILENDIVFAVGPAGTGKTFLAVAMAIKFLREGTVERIILTRPAVEAGESLGFLPGSYTDKIAPYLTPLYDALYALMPHSQIAKLQETRALEIAPLAYMRGRTLSDALIILDEAQNTKAVQMKMFLTRLGPGSRAIITGDITQIDLPKGEKSGLVEARRVLRGIRGVAFVEFTSEDVVRHPLVRAIVEAYERG